MAEHKLALVAGASGVVGGRLAEYLHGLDDWDVVGYPAVCPKMAMMSRELLSI